MSLITSEFRLLTEQQLYGDGYYNSNCLDVLKGVDRDHNFTDFARVSGAAGTREVTEMTMDKKEIESDLGIRPILSYSDISDLPSDKISKKDGILELEYGEYPQMVVSKLLANTLNEELLNGNLKETGKKYTTNKAGKYGFLPFEYVEYEYNGKKYIKGDPEWTPIELTDGEEYNREDIWIEVSPIKWCIDEKEKILVSKTCLVSGVPYDILYGDSEKEGFKSSQIYRFLNKYFAIDIIPSDVIKKFRDDKKQNLEDMLNYKVEILNSSNDNEILPSVKAAAHWWCKEIAGPDADEDDYYSTMAELLSRKPVSMTSIDKKQLKVFRDTLCKEIMEGVLLGSRVIIKVDYTPDVILSEALIESGISSEYLRHDVIMAVTSDSVEVRAKYGDWEEVFSNSVQKESGKEKK